MRRTNSHMGSLRNLRKLSERKRSIHDRWEILGNICLVYIKGFLQVYIRYLNPELAGNSMRSETSYLHSTKKCISILYKVTLGDNEDLCEKKLASFSQTSKETIVLMNQKYSIKTNEKLKISLHMSVKYTYASLIIAISNDFSSYYLNKEIGELIDFDTLLFYFKSDDLDVTTEDHVLRAFIYWYDFQLKSSEVDEKVLTNQIRNL